MKKNKIILYMRLSVEDSKTNSTSIQVQQGVLWKYVQEHFDLNEFEVEEKIDNGWSGTNFERPAMMELLQMVENGLVYAIIVRDFSRFGRNMLQSGYYIEKVFPLYQTRFLSVVDSYDSFTNKSGGLDVTFQYLIHEWYSKDLSIKSKTARHSKMARGEYCSTNTIYGYFKGSSGRLEIDEEVVENVRMIFAMAQQGLKPEEIRAKLFSLLIPTPGEYKISKGKKGYDVSRTNQLWNTSAILRILRDERYIGTYVMGKTEVIAVGGRRMKDKPEDLWHKIPNHHPAIVEESVFLQVQDLVKVKKITKGEPQVFPLKGKVICGCCQHYMQRNAKIEPEFFCRTSQRLESFPCSSLRVKESDLEEVVIAMFKNYLMLIKEEVTDIPETTEDIDALKEEKQELYEKFVSGVIDSTEYRTKKAQLDDKICSLPVKEQAKQTVQSKTLVKLRELSKRLDEDNKLTKEIVDLFLDKIIIHGADNIEVKLKVADPFTALIENQ